MHKTVAILLAAVLSYGCGRSTISGPPEIPVTPRAPGALITSFGNEPCQLTSANFIRVGWYHDFSGYDNLLISFNARRLSTESPFDEIYVRIGAATVLHDTLIAVQKNVVLNVKVRDIAKPQNCALTFRTLDPETALSLSSLRVVGRTGN